MDLRSTAFPSNNIALVSDVKTIKCVYMNHFSVYFVNPFMHLQKETVGSVKQVTVFTAQRNPRAIVRFHPAPLLGNSLNAVPEDSG